MAAGNYDLVIEQGATFYQEIIWKDSSETPIDLTGYTARMQVRKTVKSSDTILSLTTENGRITLGDDAGTITLEVDAEDTADLTEFCGVYDLELEAGDGTVTRLLQGQIEVSREVTR
jgi:hypothetical protein